MRHAKAKITVAAVVLASALGLLAYAGVQRGWVYYMEVDGFLADASMHTQRIRLNGHVDDQDVVVESTDLKASFDLLGETGRVPVVYHGVIPAMFKPGCQVVVEGQLDEHGVFQADSLMTKCASKYQADEHDRMLKQLNQVEQESAS
ncbi:cytochrome c maturation protein CcmE [Planctomycetales bacterium ZRK34]|nr:cytochrome c maturation protein CcmE [Planctomycetales bacterium ZRK34]